jgi:hypothetical protein
LFVERLEGGIKIESLLILLPCIRLKTAKEADVAKEEEAEAIDHD